jgi:biopolymer transport protein ExbD
MKPGSRLLSRLAPRRRSAARLTLTPLVDCVFILLIFFMLETRLLAPQGLDLSPGRELVPSTAAAPAQPPRVLVVELRADGSGWIDGVRHGAAQLLDTLRTVDLGAADNAVVTIDPGVRVQRAVDALDVLRARGVGRLVLREARQFK